MDLLAHVLEDGDSPSREYVPEPCKLGRILQSLSVEQAALIQRRLAEWSADKLAAKLRKTPQRVGATTIKLHVAGLCGCF